MSPHSNPSDDPPTVALDCFVCGKSYDELASKVAYFAKHTPPGSRYLPLCIKHDPEAESRDYHVVLGDEPS